METSDKKLETEELKVDPSSRKRKKKNLKESINTVEDTNCNVTLVSNEKGCDSETIISAPNGLLNGVEHPSKQSNLPSPVRREGDESSLCKICVKESDFNVANKCAQDSSCYDVENQPPDPQPGPSDRFDSNDSKPEVLDFGITYSSYQSELQMPDIMRLIQKDLSEPYSIYTYRYFIHNWPKLCFLAMSESTCVGAIVCKLDIHRKVIKRGYIAMLAVDEKFRKKKIGTNLVLKAIRAMAADDADEIVLETEITNKPALRLYENLGFVRDKRLFRYYLNGVDALRLKLWLR